MSRLPRTVLRAVDGRGVPTQQQRQHTPQETRPDAGEVPHALDLTEVVLKMVSSQDGFLMHSKRSCVFCRVAMWLGLQGVSRLHRKTLFRVIGGSV